MNRLTNQKSRRAGVLALMASAALLVACESKEDKAVKFAESGAAYLAEGDSERASIQFNNALFNDPENIPALRGAAEIARDEQNFPRQLSMLQRILAIMPDDLDANLEFADLSLRAAEPNRARDHANRVLAIEPNNVRALNTVGATLVMENRLEEASEVLERALAADPTSPDVFNLLAARSIRDEQIDEALAILEEGIVKADNPETLLVVRLVLAEQYGTPAEVEESFERLIAAAPTYGIYKARFADWLLVTQGDEDRAKTLYRGAVANLVDPTEVYLRLVGLERISNGDPAAEALLREFIAESPESTNLKFALPTFFCELKNYDDCEQEYRALAADDTLSEDEQLRAMNGITLSALASGRIDDARAANTAVLERDPRNPAALVAKARFEIRDGATETAIGTLREALDGDPDNPDGLVYLAMAYERSGQTSFADAQFARAVDQVGYIKGVVDQYRNFLLRQNEPERAAELLNRYTRNNPGDVTAAREAAELAIAAGDPTDAERRARALLELDPNDRAASLILGNALAAQDRIEEAIPFVEQGLDQDPSNRGALSLYVALMQAAGRPEAIVAKIEPRIDTGEISAFELAILNDYYRGQNALDKASAIAATAAERFPTEERSFVMNYLTKVDQEGRAAAQPILRAGIETAETTTELRAFLANDLILTDQYADAIAVLESLEAEGALTVLTGNNLASLLLDHTDRHADALRIAETLNTDASPYIADTVAWARFKNGDAAGALPLSISAATAVPDNADIQYHYGVIAAAAGRTDAAREALTAALDAARRGGFDVTVDQIRTALGQL